MSLTFKLASLAIRTVAKPVGNIIKRNAREHDGFRRYCVAFAQGLHRIDMRMRLGILHDAAAQERMIARDAAEEAAKKKQSEVPTVLTEAQQKTADEEAAKQKKEGGDKSKASKVKIRPLSETKAIDLGANFVSESFIFAVAVGLLVWDNWRTRRKENTRREGVADRIEELESGMARDEAKIKELEEEIRRLQEEHSISHVGEAQPTSLARLTTSNSPSAVHQDGNSSHKLSATSTKDGTTT
ncbi:hypothetical protein LTR66_002533 [Elasticomyces elasticus]|nr:hypothetical protein LTR66_002533 [Elasticomyces elasticus]